MSVPESTLVASNFNTPLARYDAACRAIAEARSVDEVKDQLSGADMMRAYARQAKNKQMEIDAADIRFRAERRIGELMEAQKKTVGLAKGGQPHQQKATGSKSDPVATPTLAEAGIDKHLANRARQYAAIPEQKFESILAERRQNIEAENKRVTVNLLDAAKVRGTQGTGENEWYTPNEHLELAREVLGQIDLDPASSLVAQRMVRAAKFFSEEDNGLTKEWAGNVWLNPPYAQPAISHFCEKVLEELAAGHVSSAIVLTHNYTDTGWFHSLAGEASAICFTRGRIRFVSPDGELAAPTQGQAFFYFGEDVAKFCRVFRNTGLVVRPA